MGWLMVSSVLHLIAAAGLATLVRKCWSSLRDRESWERLRHAERRSYVITLVASLGGLAMLLGRFVVVFTGYDVLREANRFAWDVASGLAWAFAAAALLSWLHAVREARRRRSCEPDRVASVGLVVVLLLGVAAAAEPQTQPKRYLIADKPDCYAGSAGAAFVALDPLDEGDCTDGGGDPAIPDHLCVCHWDGVVGEWKADRGDMVWPDRFTGVTVGTDTTTGRMIFGGTEVTRAYRPAEDDGRSRGAGATICDGTYCTTTDCGEGQGDCNAAAGQCNTAGDADTDLICRQNVGRNHGCGDAVDICLLESYWCTRSPPCSEDAPCRAGQGDCGADDAACETGLECKIDTGAAWGCGATVDVCQAPDSLCDANPISPIPEGSGDCNCDGEDSCGEDTCPPPSCAEECDTGLVCTPDVGAYYDCQPTVDICETP